MSEIILKFEVTLVDKDIDFDDDLGEDLAVFLRESVFDGGDVLDVSYKGHQLNKK